MPTRRSRDAKCARWNTRTPCGDGQFLESLQDLSGVSGTGLDTTAASIAKCRERGVEAHQGTINDCLQRAAERAGRYDVVTAFHCLEHVPDPSGFLSETSRYSRLEDGSSSARAIRRCHSKRSGSIH
ncbi:MAG: class I SAM-dependent methyltransferase [Chthoniobacterales bacterium]